MRARPSSAVVEVRGGAADAGVEVESAAPKTAAVPALETIDDSHSRREWEGVWIDRCASEASDRSSSSFGEQEAACTVDELAG